MPDAVRTDIGPFAMVPEWLLFDEQRKGTKISDKAIRLFATLHRHHGAGGIWPSRATLADEMNCSADSVDRAIKELVAAQALTVESRFEARRGKPERISNLYVLHFLPLPSRTDAATPGRVDAGPTSRKDAALTRTHLNESPSERESQLAGLAQGPQEGASAEEVDGYRWQGGAPGPQTRDDAVRMIQEAWPTFREQGRVLHKIPAWGEYGGLLDSPTDELAEAIRLCQRDGQLPYPSNLRAHLVALARERPRVPIPLDTPEYLCDCGARGPRDAIRAHKRTCTAGERE